MIVGHYNAANLVPVDLKNQNALKTMAFDQQEFAKSFPDFPNMSRLRANMIPAAFYSRCTRTVTLFSTTAASFYITATSGSEGEYLLPTVNP
ncbi:MAG TPA: hypothetical protein DC017_16410 [Candidatus Wallbacteria bacterium]|nr:hypothetical protein [Candidatus Wallbacteria bacterium]